MKNFGESMKLNHNSDSPYITHYSYRILIAGQSGSRKINALLESNENLQVINTELLIAGKKIKISDVFISQIYFTLPINKKMHATYYSIMKAPNMKTPRFK